MRDEQSRRELTVALVAAVSWLAVVLIALICSVAACGQSSGSVVFSPSDGEQRSWTLE